MAEIYDTSLACALVEGDYVRLFGKDVILSHVDDRGAVVYVQGTVVSDKDTDFEEELDPYLDVPLLME